MTEIISAVDKNLIIDELQGKLLCHTQKAGNKIYIISYHSAPNTMKEIGRLREISFRQGGGGSGNSIDIDEYDSLEKPFQQLIVWNPDEQEIIGGYRFLHGSEATYTPEGKPIMPMGHIFNFSERYLKDFLPYSIELGRAFIQPKYQSYKGGIKSLYALDNLWDGIGMMISTYENIRFMIGKITIFPKMQIEARYSIMHFLNKFYADTDKLIIPIDSCEERVPNNFAEYFDNLFSKDSVKDNMKVLTTYLKERGERIPPLIKAYIDLASTMKSFGTCLDKDFGNIYDTGIMIDINDIHKNKKDRYLTYYMRKQSVINIVNNIGENSTFTKK